MAAERKGTPHVVEGQVAKFISREDFRKRYDANFYDPAFDVVREEISKLEAIAWDAYQDGRKAPKTAKAGPGFADPDYDLSMAGTTRSIWRAGSTAWSSTETSRESKGLVARCPTGSTGWV